MTFTLSSFPHGKVPSVIARNGSRKLVDPHKISAILPFDLWPEFAVETFRQRVGKNDDERLF